MRLKHINLADVHDYTDVTPIPQRFHRRFDICLNDAGVDHDLLPVAIDRYGVWEQMETIFLCSAFAAADPDKTMFLDLGSHIGWFSLLANTYGILTVAIDINQQQLDCLAQVNDGGIICLNERIDADWQWTEPVLRPDTYIVKMDLEGCEVDAVNGLWTWFETKRITHCLMEVSPVFNGSYPNLLKRLIDLGYACYVMPPKQTPPPVYRDPLRFRRRHCEALHLYSDEERLHWINDQHQFNAILHLPEAKWG
jgi:hypothetical protein